MAFESKHRKLAPAEIPAEPEDIEDILAAELARIVSMQDSLEATLAEGGASPALLRESNGLTAALARVSAELRQRDKHNEQMVEDLTQEQEDIVVMEHLAEISPQRRATFREFLKNSDEESNLLGHE